VTGGAGRLSERVAIVTGAGQGLGLGIARALAEENAAVALLGRTFAKIEAAAETLSAAGLRAVAVRCDVADRDDAAAAVATTVATFGGVDVLVNGAQGGNTTVRSATAEVSDEQMLESFRTGPLGTLHMMQACFEHLRASEHAAVVNFGSGIGVRGAPGMAGYAMAKEAIGALTKVTAIEWGKHGIRVNLVCPAGMSPAAEAYRDQDLARWDKHLRETPLRRLGDPHDDIGRAVLALVSDDMRYLTGATLMLDGGQVINR